MKRLTVAFLALAGLLSLFLWSPAKADVFQIDSAPYNDGTMYVSPYNSRLNGIEIRSFCIEYTNHVGFGQVYEVNLVNLHDFAGIQHDSYWEAGWIALQIQSVTDINILSAANRAIWLITTPGTTDPYLTSASSLAWVSQALQNYQSVADNSFTLVLRAGDPGQAQLLIGAVPEPETWAIFGIGLISLIGFCRMGQIQRKNRK